MTRESLARALAFATAVLVVLLAAVFAVVRNLSPAAPTPATSPAQESAAAAAGRAAFVELGCTACHSAEGRGNPALPLDGVGGRLGREELRAAAFGTAAGLPQGVAEIKRRNARGVDGEVLVEFLWGLK